MFQFTYLEKYLPLGVTGGWNKLYIWEAQNSAWFLAFISKLDIINIIGKLSRLEKDMDIPGGVGGGSSSSSA